MLISADPAVQKLLTIQALALLTGGLVTLIALAAMTQAMHRDANQTHLERGRFHDTIPDAKHSPGPSGPGFIRVSFRMPGFKSCVKMVQLEQKTCFYIFSMKRAPILNFSLAPR